MKTINITGGILHGKIMPDWSPILIVLRQAHSLTCSLLSDLDCPMFHELLR